MHILLNNADNLVTDDKGKQSESKHVTTALKAKECEPWMFDITKKKRNKEKGQEPTGQEHNQTTTHRPAIYQRSL